MKRKYTIAALVLLLLAATTIIIVLRNQRGARRVNPTVEVLLDWQMSPPYAAYVLADVNGYYADEGITVKLVQGQGAETTAKLVGQGQYSIGTCNAAATAIAIDNRVPIISVAMVEQDAVTAIFSLKKSNIVKPSDLVGKTLGVRYFDISHKEYLAMMHAKGLDPKGVKEVNVGFDLQPLLTGQVDALYNYAYNMPVQLKQKGYELNTIFVKDEGVIGYGSNIIANQQFANEHGETIVKFLRAARRGWEAARANPEAAAEALKTRYPELASDSVAASIRAQLTWVFPTSSVEQKPPLLFTQSLDRWRLVLQTYRDLELIKRDIEPATVFSDNYLR